MTDLVPYKPQQRDVIDGWVDMLPSAVELAKYIHSTEFVPANLRNKPAAVCAAILSGREIGLAPMQALQHVNVVDGRPQLDAEMCRALVVAAGHELRFPERTTTRCVIAGRRRGQEEWTTVSFSMDDARRARLDGKSNWQKYPRRMLDARATSELCHLIFPDVIGGIAVSEEAEDDRPAITDDQPAPHEPKRTAQRKSRSAPVSVSPPKPAPSTPPDNQRHSEPPPPLPGEEGFDTVYIRKATTTAADEVLEPETEPTPDDLRPVDDEATAKQSRMLNALFSKHNVGGRVERRDLAGKIIGREIGSQKDMSRQEVSTLIDTLERLEAVDGEDLTDLVNRIALANIVPADANADYDPDTGEIIPDDAGIPADQPALDEEDPQ